MVRFLEHFIFEYLSVRDLDLGIVPLIASDSNILSNRMVFSQFHDAPYNVNPHDTNFILMKSMQSSCGPYYYKSER